MGKASVVVRERAGKVKRGLLWMTVVVRVMTC